MNINLLYSLPKNIIELIYSYDSTYHNIYNKIKNEFHKLTPYWKVTNDVLESNYYYSHSISEYKLNYYKANEIKNMWNKNIIVKLIKENPYYNFMTESDIEKTFSTNTKNTIVSLFDFHPNIYKMLFYDIKQIANKG